ncbi:glycosyl hydrolase family 71-domain-containing protein [Mrakia frigida]|uniref:glycosyl hydrolase family 71-domain-containing protein n=1 Tax=Mrakia frigida TaxID=29902 RepID=UPI003FCC204A
MKSFTGTIALLGLLLSSSSSLSVEAHVEKKSPSRSRSHHNHIASALSVKSTTTLERRATPSGWSLVGCVTEGTAGARVLPSYSAQGLSSLTVESCLATCASMAYTYGGLEFGEECYCSDTLDNGGGLTSTSTNCNKPCTGDSSETCGGTGYMSLYKTTDTSCIVARSDTYTDLGCFTDKSTPILTGGVMTSTSTNTPTTCMSYCSNLGYAYAGVEYGTQCFCGKANTGVAASSSSCSSACSGNAALKCGGFYAINVYLLPTSTTTSSAAATTTASANIVSGGTTWKPLGCYVDSSSLSGYKDQTATNTPATCIATCLSKGFSYAGVEYGAQCFCGNTLTASTAPSTDCNVACRGDAKQICGGAYRLNIYQKIASTTTTTTSAPAATATSSLYTSLGCYADYSTNRQLSGSISSSYSMTTELCTTTCFNAGFTYAGTQYGAQCYCGNTMPSTTSTACLSACAGNSAQICGGAYALSVFKTATTTTTSTTTPAISGWKHTGCYSDSGGARALTGFAQTGITTNTLQTCTALCASKGFSIAGAEYGSECYCGNAISGSSTIQASTQCANRCAGNSAQICGGTNRITIYTAVSPTWNNVGCVTDSGAARALNGTSTTSSTMTVESCQTFCKNAGYTLAGVEDYTQCWCGNSLNSGAGITATGCTAPCGGNAAQTCGGNNVMNLYNYGTAAISPNTQLSTTGPGGCAAAGSYTPTLGAPASSSTKYVFSHHIVGNTYPYTAASWNEDVAMAYDSGVDAFALNLGTDSWQRTQTAAAYEAARAHGKGFKLFFSFDMSVWGCGTISGSMVDYIVQFAAHPNQYLYNGKVFVSTFAGETCGDAAWVNLRTLLTAKGVSMYFLPGFFGGTSWSSWKSMDGIMNWNSAWSMDTKMITTATDYTYMSALGTKSYLPGVAPNFFAHYGVNSYNKNWFYQSDAWVLAVRWQQLIAMRDKYDWVEELTWNDYGESHYMGPIKGAQPNSQSWVNGFDHTPLLQVNAYYHTAFKTGSYPAITCDKIYLHARPHINTAVATADTAGGRRPTLGQNGAAGSHTAAANNFFALVFATSAGTVVMKSGSSSQKFSVPAGITILTAPLTAGSGMTATLSRSGKTYVDFTPAFTFSATTTEYNWNHQYYASS